MRHALSKQGYDRKAPVDLQLIRSSGATIARPTCRWFRSPKKKEPLFSQARAPFFRRKAISTLGTYRVVHALWPNQVVCYVDGPELAKEVVTKG